MRVKVQQWGSSLAVCIPKPIAEDIGLRPGADVDLSIQDRSLNIAPTRRQYTLEELVNGITPENRHSEIDFGPFAGCEVL
ncbi:MAG TPA: AbrB/MazE/SpoVT family DNA-binding domain-containing protein [Thermoanaerobaculia bacterium]|nr:AbrB/MazE/SpoVT family DNA-binding domain-containing protein [Thermoanaerobaculia bacterium]